MSNVLLYIDPGSGSYLIQMLIAGALGAMFFFKNGWNKVKSFFNGKRPDPSREKDNDL